MLSAACIRASPAAGPSVGGSPSILPSGSSTLTPRAFCLTGDKFSVKIGDNVNIQDGSTVGSSVSKLTDPKPTFIGNNVSIGHNATVRGCTIDDNVLIGNSAMVLEDCKVRAAPVRTRPRVRPSVRP